MPTPSAPASGRTPPSVAEERVRATLRRLGPPAAATAVVGYAVTLVLMHAVFGMPFHPLGWTNVYGVACAAVSLGIMARGHAHVGAVFLISGVVIENLADFVMSPMPVSETVPFAPLIVTGAGLLIGMHWSAALAALYVIALPVMVLLVPHARPVEAHDIALMVMAMIAVLAAVYVAFAAKRLYASLLAQADASGQRARRLIDRAPDGIVVMRHDGRVVDANRAAQGWFAPAGLAVDAALPERLVRHDGSLSDAAFLRSAVQQLLRGRIVGTEHEVAVTASVLEGEGDQTLYELMVRVVPSGPRRSPPRGVRPPAEGALRVLLVDDDDMVRTALGLQLGRAGYAVTTAADAEAALSEVRLRGGDFDVLLTDVVMPGMTGADLTRHARALRPTLPVVLMSGDPRQVLRGLDVPGPAWVFLAKPFSMPELRAAFARARGDVPAPR